jgi:hypothetical protein
MLHQSIIDEIQNLMVNHFHCLRVRMCEILKCFDKINIDHRNATDLYGGSIYSFLRRTYEIGGTGYYRADPPPLPPLPPPPTIVPVEYLLENINDEMWFGVEIEFASSISGTYINDLLGGLDLTAEVSGNGGRYSEHGNNISYEDWNVTYDSSIRRSNTYNHQIEIVSPILKGKQGLLELHKVMNKLKDMEHNDEIRVDMSCGLHVHVSYAEKTMKESHLFNLVRLYSKNENHIDSVMPPSRRGNKNEYCRKVVMSEYFDNNRDIDNVRRSSKLNFNSFATRNTIEFRHHGGTFDFVKAANWIIMVQHMMVFAGDYENFSLVDCSNVVDFGIMLRLDTNVIEYFGNRSEELNNDARQQDRTRREEYAMSPIFENTYGEQIQNGCSDESGAIRTYSFSQAYEMRVLLNRRERIERLHRTIDPSSLAT